MLLRSGPVSYKAFSNRAEQPCSSSLCQGITHPWKLSGPAGIFRADPTLKLDPATKATQAAQGCVQLGFKHLQEWRLLVLLHTRSSLWPLLWWRKIPNTYLEFPWLQPVFIASFLCTSRSLALSSLEAHVINMNKIIRSHFTFSSQVRTNTVLSVSHLVLQIPPSQQTGPFIQSKNSN